MANVTSDVIGTIGAVQTLIENFPMSIFAIFGNKIYSDPIEFIMDVLRQLGITNRVLVDKLIELFFGVPNAIELYGDISNYTYKVINKPTEEQISMAVEVPDIPEPINADSPNYIVISNEENETQTYYVKKAPIPTELQSEFMTGMEDSIKGIILNILVGLLSCSVIPEIPDYCLDNNSYDRGFILTKQSFDLLNMLDINPLSEIGKNYYSGVDDESLTVNDLYKSNDLNAFLWYVLNRGNTFNQIETNKMVWDSRIVSEKEENDDEKRKNESDWNDWLTSKSGNTPYFWFKDKNRYEEAFYNSGNTTIDIPLHPILQFEPALMNNAVKISFPWQTWDIFGATFNKSIYEFNSDYLNNIQVFNPRLVITEMINSLLNGSLLLDLNPNYSIQTKVIEAKLGKIIKQALEVEDTTVDDCFFIFSNDEFNSALKNMELQKYGAKELNSETSPAIKIDPNLGIDAINEINSMATMEEKLTSISKTVYDIAAIPTQDASVEITDKFSLGYNEEWIKEVVFALVKPLARAIFTPKVMMLFLINFQIMGLININDVNSLNEVVDLILKKMIAIVLSLINFIKDKIIVFLMDLFYETIKPLLIKWGIVVLKEKLDAWIDLLEEAIRCIPLFDFNRYSVQTDIDNVNYADITQVQTIPETEKTC